MIIKIAKLLIFVLAYMRSFKIFLEHNNEMWLIHIQKSIIYI